MTLDVDDLARSDVPAAHALSAQAGWGSRERDWRRLFSTPGVRTFAGRVDGDLVATATVAVYGPPEGEEDADAVAWIGTILVDEAHRRRGYGTRIFEAALADARERAAVVGLDANDSGKSIYEAAGFVDVARAATWHGTLSAAGASDHLEPTVSACADPAAVAALDARACGVDRSGLLRALFADPTSRGFLARDGGDVTGYVLVRPSESGWTVGPLIALGPASVPSLLAAVAGVTGDDSVSLNVGSDPSPAVAAAYREAGLDRVRTLARMTDGRQTRALLGEAVRAIPGYKYG